MGDFAPRPRRWTRRAVFGFLAGSALAVEHGKGATLPSDAQRFADPATELEVYRLTGSGYSSYLPAYYARTLSRKNNFLLCWSDRSGAAQAYRMNLKTGEWQQITDVGSLDGSSLTLLPDDRGFCFFDGPALKRADLSRFREREIYRVPEGWERCPGASVNDDGRYAVFAECRQGASRLQLVNLLKGDAATIAEAPWIMSHPVARPRRTQVLYRQANAELWLVNFDGRENRRLKITQPGIGPAKWASDGKTILYLRFPEDRTQLNTIREHTPDENSDQQVAKTSQFAHFDANPDTSVFVGASRNQASPHILLLVRAARRELTVCEHRASNAESVAPVFSSNSQQIFFQSDKGGKSAIYRVRVDRFVAETDSDI